MVDTAGTLCKAAEILKENGARRVFAFATHGVLSGPAPKRIANSVLTELVCLDTVPLSEASLVTNSYYHNDNIMTYSLLASITIVLLLLLLCIFVGFHMIFF